MLKKYKNELFILINDTNLNPSDFTMEENTYGNGVGRNTLTYKNTELKLSIDENPSTFHSFKVTGTKFEKNFPSSSLTDKYSDFSIIKSYIKTWLNDEVKGFIEEDEEQDFWQVQNNINNQLKLEFIDFEDESPFTVEDKEQIILALGEAKSRIKNKVDLNMEQELVLDSRIEYLIKVIDRVENKTDWKTIAIGGILSTILNMGVDTETGKMLWEIFKVVFSSIPQLPM